MAVDLLDESTVAQYLKTRKVFSPSAEIEVETLAGGVSNVVLAVKAEGKEFVLKQALPELKVATKWVVEQRRALVEARALEVLHTLTPPSVPKLIDVDAERFVLLIERAPRETTNWKEDLLVGTIHSDVAEDLGRILGHWHKETSLDPEILSEFEEDSLFEQLRINPFYRTLNSQHLDIAPRINSLIEELESDKSALVHGDFSPKNILVVKNSKAIVLDFEVAHTGNPVFDLAFLLGHVMCKQEFFSDQKQKNALAQCAEKFIAHYEIALGTTAHPSLLWHAATIALARVDGVSRVHYLDAQGQQSLRTRAVDLLSRTNVPTLSEVFFRP